MLHIRNMSSILGELFSVVDIDDYLGANQAERDHLFAVAGSTARAAFEDGSQAALRDVHLTLFRIYDLSICPPAAPHARHQLSIELLRLRKLLEVAWLAHEDRRVEVFRASDDATAGIKVRLVTAWQTHPSFHTPIFPFLAREADEAQVKRYFSSDYKLNVHFYDLIVLALVGAAGPTRPEIAGNFWDEMGKGGEQLTHVRLYERLLDYFGISGDSDPATMTWQALAGYNTMLRMAITRDAYLEYVGALAITELADPRQYGLLLEGCKRLGLGADNPEILDYYSEHVTVDAIHGEGWVDHVIVPLVGNDPDKARHVMRGAFMRLNTSADYWDRLLESMTTAQA